MPAALLLGLLYQTLLFCQGHFCKPPLAARAVRGGGICGANDGGDLLQITEYSVICNIRIPSGPLGQRPYPLWPYGPFPPDKGNRPLGLKGSLLGAPAPV